MLNGVLLRPVHYGEANAESSLVSKVGVSSNKISSNTTKHCQILAYVRLSRNMETGLAYRPFNKGRCIILSLVNRIPCPMTY